MVGALMEKAGRPSLAKVLEGVEPHPDPSAGAGHPLWRQGREAQHATQNHAETA